MGNPHKPSLQSICSGHHRRAWPKDVDASDLSRAARQVWDKLCDHRNAENLCYLTLQRIANHCRVSVRTVQRAIQELTINEWICFPHGNVGGRPSRGCAGSVVYHLHPDGQRCGVAQNQRTQTGRKRPDVAARNETRDRGKTESRKEKHDKASCFCGKKTMTTTPVNHDNGDIAYKEGTAKNRYAAAAAESLPRGSFPKTQKTVRQFFPATGDGMVRQIIECAQGQRPRITDSELADVVESARCQAGTRQKSAALFRNTVPEILKSTAEYGASAPALTPVRRPISKEQRTLRALSDSYDEEVEVASRY